MSASQKGPDPIELPRWKSYDISARQIRIMLGNSVIPSRMLPIFTARNDQNPNHVAQIRSSCIIKDHAVCARTMPFAVGIVAVNRCLELKDIPPHKTIHIFHQ